MREYMKDIIKKLKESFYGILPGFLLFGVPTIIATAVWLITNRNAIPRIMHFITIVGNGSFAVGLVTSILGFLGFINAFIAFLLWAKHFFDYLDDAKYYFQFWVPIIIAAFSWFAFLKIISVLIALQ